MIPLPLFLLMAIAIALGCGCQGAWRCVGPNAGRRVRWYVPDPMPGDSVERSRAILHDRYARGEIATEEYRERIDQLF